VENQLCMGNGKRSHLGKCWKIWGKGPGGNPEGVLPKKNRSKWGVVSKREEKCPLVEG